MLVRHRVRGRARAAAGRSGGARVGACVGEHGDGVQPARLRHADARSCGGDGGCGSVGGRALLGVVQGVGHAVDVDLDVRVAIFALGQHDERRHGRVGALPLLRTRRGQRLVPAFAAGRGVRVVVRAAGAARAAGDAATSAAIRGCGQHVVGVADGTGPVQDVGDVAGRGRGCVVQRVGDAEAGLVERLAPHARRLLVVALQRVELHPVGPVRPNGRAVVDVDAAPTRRGRGRASRPRTAVAGSWVHGRHDCAAALVAVAAARLRAPQDQPRVRRACCALRLLLPAPGPRDGGGGAHQADHDADDTDDEAAVVLAAARATAARAAARCALGAAPTAAVIGDRSLLGVRSAATAADNEIAELVVVEADVDEARAHNVVHDDLHLPHGGGAPVLGVERADLVGHALEDIRRGKHAERVDNDGVEERKQDDLGFVAAAAGHERAELFVVEADVDEARAHDLVDDDLRLPHGGGAPVLGVERADLVRHALVDVRRGKHAERVGDDGVEE